MCDLFSVVSAKTVFNMIVLGETAGSPSPHMLRESGRERERPHAVIQASFSIVALACHSHGEHLPALHDPVYILVHANPKDSHLHSVLSYKNECNEISSLFKVCYKSN